MESKIFDLFKTVLLAHIETKTTESQFHEKSQEFYEILFDCFHQISEKMQDTEENKPADCKIAIQSTYDSLESAKSIIEDMIWEKQTIWMDNLLRWLFDKLEWACWNAKAFIEKESEEMEKEIEKPKMWIKIPR